MNLSAYKRLRKAIRKEAYSEALSLTEQLLCENQLAIQLILLRARLLQVTPDLGQNLQEAEKCLILARRLDPEAIEVLEESMHFYDVIFPDVKKATRYAVRLRKKSAQLMQDANEVLQNETKVDKG